MFEAINRIIENEIKESNLDSYSVILGISPSEGARSPNLWNKVYEFEKKNIQMVPLDVRQENLEELFNHLKHDEHCLGGAVAVPYKEKIFNLIKGNVKKEIESIRAVNCFYRKPTGSLIDEFTGTNTDGEAALEPVMEYLEQNKDLNIGLMGYGGAGKAIAAYLLKDFKHKHQIQVFNRTPIKPKSTNIVGLDTFLLGDLDHFLPHFDLLINATSVGHIDSSYASPVATRLLAKAKKTLIVYDIIYDPIKTALLQSSEKIGLRTINGLRMNLTQAVLAYGYTNPTNLVKEEIYKIMS